MVWGGGCRCLLCFLNVIPKTSLNIQLFDSLSVVALVFVYLSVCWAVNIIPFVLAVITAMAGQLKKAKLNKQNTLSLCAGWQLTSKITSCLCPCGMLEGWWWCVRVKGRELRVNGGPPSVTPGEWWVAGSVCGAPPSPHQDTKTRLRRPTKATGLRNEL